MGTTSRAWPAPTITIIIAGWHAKVAELVDALALGASGATRESSSLSFRTRFVFVTY